MGDLGRLLREMVRNARFSASLIAVLTLTFGLAAGAFTFTDGILLKPLRYDDSERLVAIWAARPNQGLDRLPLTQWDVQHVAERSDVFESVGGFTQQRSAMQLPDEVVEIGLGWLTADLHDVLNVHPILGRTFTEEDRGEMVVLLDHGFWERWFGADPGVLGQTVRIAQQEWTVIGVLPPGDPLALPSRGRVPIRTDVWSTMWVDGADPDATQAWIFTTARLAEGVSLERAQAELAQVAAVSRDLFSERETNGFLLTADRLRRDFTAGISQELWLLFAATLVLLLAAVANAGNLMTLRNERHRHRTAIRLAVGASTRRIALTAWAEAGIFTALAALLAIPLAQGLVSFLLSRTPADIPRLDAVDFDGRALAFLALLALFTAGVVGALSAIGTRRIPVDDVIRRNPGRTGAWSGASLVSAEVAFAIPLLIVGALLARSAQARGQIDPGFPSDGAVTLRLALPNQGIERTELTTILEHLEDRLRSLPGVESVGSANLIPLGGGAFSGPVAADDPGLDEPGNVATDFRFVTPGYLESLGLPLLAGTGPGTADREREVVVDQALVEALWPGEDPIGRTLAARPLGDRRADFVVVGVVADTRHETLLEPGRPTIYFLSPNYTLPYMTTVVRGSLEPASLFASARQFGGEVHPDLLVAEARDLDEVVGSGSALTRWLVRIVTTLALGAALITAVGLYAVVGQFVSAYRSALGVRRALGARSADLVAVVIGRVSRVLFTGLAIGVAFAGLASAWLRTELVGVGPADPLTWVGSLLAMALLAAAAVALPTRSAVSVSPLDVLKAE